MKTISTTCSLTTLVLHVVSDVHDVRFLFVMSLNIVEMFKADLKEPFSWLFKLELCSKMSSVCNYQEFSVRKSDISAVFSVIMIHLCCRHPFMWFLLWDPYFLSGGLNINIHDFIFYVQTLKVTISHWTGCTGVALFSWSFHRPPGALFLWGGLPPLPASSSVRWGLDWPPACDPAAFCCSWSSCWVSILTAGLDASGVFGVWTFSSSLIGRHQTHPPHPPALLPL